MLRTPLVARAIKMPWWAGALMACLCCACSPPKPPPTDEPPAPKAAIDADTQLRDAIRKPIDKAKAVEQTIQDAADKQRAEIDAQG